MPELVRPPTSKDFACHIGIIPTACFTCTCTVCPHTEVVAYHIIKHLRTEINVFTKYVGRSDAGYCLLLSHARGILCIDMFIHVYTHSDTHSDCKVTIIFNIDHSPELIWNAINVYKNCWLKKIHVTCT